MYLQQEQFNVLTSLKSECKKREGSFILTRNNKWIYKPSEEYVKMKEKVQEQAKSLGVKRDSMIQGLKETCNKLDRISKAMNVATSRGKKVSHIQDGKIILTN